MLLDGYPAISRQAGPMGFAVLGTVSVDELCKQLLMQPEAWDPAPAKTRISAAARLALLKDPDAIPCLLNAAVNDPNKTVRLTVVTALGYAVGNDDVVHILTIRLHPFLGDTDSDVRAHIVKTLRKITTVDSAYLARTALGRQLFIVTRIDPSERVRKLADEALREMLKDGVVPPEALTPVNGTPPPEPNDTEPEKKLVQPRPVARRGLSRADKTALGVGLAALLGLGVLGVASRVMR
jgi:hypothetical protein